MLLCNFFEKYNEIEGIPVFFQTPDWVLILIRFSIGDKTVIDIPCELAPIAKVTLYVECLVLIS
ncbi:conserved hypothetical protein [Methanosarcina thermophila]|uniref:Uncharacterized protein n=1 Tax=Methanosarcina thermophila TaxID=2210 RepID=A0A3G9CWG4_METTE|nr:conserved hypothetical protein [Methanosarcina thermophila]